MLGFKDWSIGTKLFAGLVLIVFIAGSIATYLNWHTARLALQNQVTGDLQALTYSKSSHVESYLAHLRARAIDFSSDGFIRDSAVAIINGQQDAVEALNAHLRQNQASLDPDIAGIVIYNQQGTAIASTDGTEIGRDESDDTYFREAKQLPYGQAHTSDVLNHKHFNLQRSIAASAPLTHKETGAPIGVLVNYVRTDGLDAIIEGSQKTGLLCGSNKENPSSFLIKDDGSLISSSCAQGAVPVSLESHLAIDACASGNAPTLYDDQFGNNVVGSNACLNNGWILISELPTSIAFAGFADIKKQIGIAIAVIVIVSLMILYVQIRAVVQPLKNMARAADQIRKGDWKRRVTVKSSDEIGRLGAAFNQMISRLNRIDKAKTEFVSIASHQLRSPLTTINWSTQSLLEGDAGKLTKKQRPYFENILNSSKVMNQLVGALLNVSRIELGAFAVLPKQVNLSSQIEEIIKELSPEGKKAKITIVTQFGLDAEIGLDPNLFRIMVHNYLTNAIKYSPAGSSVTLTTTKEKQHVVISVKDQGLGIPANATKKVFTKFFRADNVRAKDVEGNGLGLYIVKQIAKQVGGRVWFESKAGRGSTFYLSLPLSGMKKRTGTKSLIADGV